MDQRATLLTGSAELDRPGYFYAPTLRADMASDSPAILHEIFGPVLTLPGFDDDDQALSMSDHPTCGFARASLHGTCHAPCG